MTLQDVLEWCPVEIYCLPTPKSNWLIDNCVNELIELTSVCRNSGPIAVGIDAIILSSLDIKNSLESLDSCFLFSCFGRCYTSWARSNFKEENFWRLQFAINAFSMYNIRFSKNFSKYIRLTFSYSDFSTDVFDFLFLRSVFLIFLFNLKSSSSNIGYWCVVYVFILSCRTESKIFSSNLRYISRASSILEATSKFKHVFNNLIKSSESNFFQFLYIKGCWDLHCFTLLSEKPINEWCEEVMKLFDLTLIEI